MEKRRKQISDDESHQKALDKLERKALMEQEKRKKPGVCLKVGSVIIHERFIAFMVPIG